MTRRILLGLVSVGLFGCAHWGGEGKEVRVSIDQVPPAVKATILKEAGGAKVANVDKEVEGAKTTYETDVAIDGKNWEIKVAEDNFATAQVAMPAGGKVDPGTAGQFPGSGNGGNQHRDAYGEQEKGEEHGFAFGKHHQSRDE